MSYYHSTLTPSSRKAGEEGSGVAVIIALVAMVPLVLFNGLVISLMWNWFIPNVFVSAPKLSVGGAIGLALVVETFFHFPEKEKENRGVWVELIVTLLTPLLRGTVLLTVGFIVHGVVY